MNCERQDTMRLSPLPTAFLALVLCVLAPYSAHSKVAASFKDRLTNEVQNGVCIARTRAPGTDLVTGYMTDGFSRWVSYEPQRSLVSAVSNFFGSARVSTFGYANDAAGRRTAISRGGAAMGALAGASDAYGYNTRSEVVSARRTLGADPVGGFAFDYAYDPIGNRTSATEYDESGAPLSSAYAANALNQYTSRTVPGYAAVRGEADTNAFVTVNERPVARTGAYFHGGDYADNTVSNLYADLEIYAAINPPGTNVPDTVYSVTTSVFVAKTPETFTYDADGNMTSDGRFAYTWNAENRMVMASNAEVVVTYAYDHRGRMVKKQITRSAADPALIEYLWDNWNIIREELRTPHSQLRTTHNLWGLDLDGTMQGAGGVGGLLAVVRDGETYLPTYDANGNVSEYVSAADGTIAAHYDYSPFGETLVASGPLAASFTHRFSTKPYCQTTGFCEYQYRKYNLNLGRWMSRDPIGERGGRNIYSFVINRPISAIDKMGLIVIYIGGAMEGTLGTLAEFKKEVGADVSFEWSQKSEVVARIKAAVKANPCEPVIVIGHSWGGDTAMDVVDDFEGDKCMKCLYVVTLDPVSQFDPDTWFGGPNPGSQVTEWINIAQPATFMDVVVDIPVVGWIVGWFWAGGSAIVRDNDGIATGGGQWNSESQATFDIPAITPNGEVLNHHDVDGMIHLELPGKNQTVIQYIEKLKKRDCCQ